MEIEIQSKVENPLLKRTEVHFTILHDGEKTPKRELVRSELAEKLNVKKENIFVNAMNASFGSTATTGYAKVYRSVKEAQDKERDHVLKRNNAFVGEKKEGKDTTEKPAEESPKEEPPAQEQKEEQSTDVPPAEEPTPEQPDETSAEKPPADEPKQEQPADDPNQEKPAEEKKEET